MKLADLYVEIRTRGMGRLNASLRTLETRLQKTQAAMAGLASISRKVFMGGAAIMGGATWAAMKFQKQLAMVSTMLDETSMKIMPVYAKGLKDLSVEFGEGTATLAKGLYDILSASVAPEKALKVLAIAAKAATAGFTSTATSADVITTVLNAYQISADKANMVSDKLFATVKRGKLTFDQLASSLGMAAATSAAAGLSLDELLATIATVTRAGVSSHAAMTSVVGVLRAFLKPTTDGAKAAKELGFELSTAHLRANGLVAIFKKLSGANIEMIAKVFPNIRGIKAVAAAMQDAKGHAFDLSFMQNAAGMTAEAFGKASNTLAFRLGQLRHTITAAAEELGQEFIPYVERAAEKIRSLVASFRNLSEIVKGSIARVILITTALAGLAMLLPKLVAGIKLVVSAMILLTAHPIIALASAIAFVTLKTVKWKEVIEAMKNAWEWLKPVRVAMSKLGHVIGVVLVKAWEKLQDALQRVFGWMLPTLKQIAGFMKKVLVGAIISVIVAIEKWDVVFKLLWVNAKLDMLVFWEELKHTFMERIPKTLIWLKDNWINIFRNMFRWTEVAAKNLFKNVKTLVEALTDFAEGKFEKLAKWEWKDLQEGLKQIALSPLKFDERVMGETEKNLRGQIAKLAGSLRGRFNELWNEIMVPKDIAPPMDELFKKLVAPWLKLRDVVKMIWDDVSDRVKRFWESDAGEGAKKKIDVEVKPTAGRWSGLQDIYKQLQSGLLKDDTPRKQLAAMEKVVKATEETARNTADGNITVLG